MKQRTSANRDGFTLIELLVVIAIIALLITILLPSLDAARRRSKQTACLSHIKNIATSSRVYAAGDVNGFGIPIHPLQFAQCDQETPDALCRRPIFIGAYEWGGKSGIGRDDWVTGSPGNPLNSKYGSLAGFGPDTRPLNEILFPGGFPSAFGRRGFDRIQAKRDTQLELGLYRCPGDDGPPRGAHCPDWLSATERSSYDHFGNSYASNVFLVGHQNTQVGSNSPYLRPLSRVSTPSRTIFYEENIGRWAWSARREACAVIPSLQPGVDPGVTKNLRGWHGRDWTYNRSFVDTHAETQKIYLEGTEDEEGYARHYRNERLESYPQWLDGSPGSFNRYQCIIVRGDGWQKDTMPDPPIPTGLVPQHGGRPSYEACVTAN